MDSETSIAAITNVSYDVKAPETEGAFHANWEAADAALLQPSNLTIPKARRAWDRKPLKPFSSQRIRVGKVWKRPMPALRNSLSEDANEEGRIMKRRKARNSFSGPLKPVKKICLASDFGLGARVLQWDTAESPVRKIVTRSNASATEIVALPDEEDVEPAEEEGDVTVEILDEDGTILEIGGEELEEEQGWEDETNADDEDLEELFDRTMMHLGDLARNDEEAALPETVNELGLQDMPLESSAEEQIATQIPNQEPIIALVDRENHVVECGPSEERLSHSVVLVRSRDVVLPDGFVSPVKRSRPFGRRSARQSLSSRRRTLPVQFAPAVISEGSASSDATNKLEQQQAPVGVELLETEGNLELQDLVADELVPSDVLAFGPQQEWEDVKDEPVASHDISLDNETEGEFHERGNIALESATASTVESALQIAEDERPEPDIGIGTQGPVVQHAALHTEIKLPSSPLPLVEGRHPRLPLRRSPRRKSSSPLKQSTILLSTEKPHLVAFTPLRGPPRYPSPSNYPGLADPFLDEGEDQLAAHSPLKRAASAPPEEPQMSPQKPSKPRVSDDTALLQAFLNRAAESKSSRRISTTKRESITNRRDSDAVRQALASPAKADVLADLDPNSPSPRKSSSTLDNTGVFDGIELGYRASLEEQFDEAKSGPTTRRGDRAARRAQPSTSAAPNKIAIRGNAENFLLKRSEAQELATLTRNNTRKNKGGAVLPPLRLTKLASQTSNLIGDTASALDATDAEPVPGSRNVKWAETLVEFYQGGEISEVSVLSDELNAPAQLEQISNADNETVVARPPPPSETPSKPKIRRLKAPRTAATPGKPLPAPPAAETDKLAAPEIASKGQAKLASSTKRRSRIATPAKGLTNASLLPSGIEPEHVIQAPAGGRKVAPKKKATVSKLPAPSTTSSSVSTSLGQGKENLISSPPKKRAVPTVKTFAPKLDFAGKTQLQPAPTGGMESGTSDVVPGLMSPAKKAKGRGIVFANVPAPDFGAGVEEVPGLSSPAKKRTRRAGGV